MHLSFALCGSIVGVALTSVLATSPACAQSLSPMRREIVSFTDRFALKLTAGNTSESVQAVAIRVFDVDWNEIDDVWVSRPVTDVAAGGRVDVLVIAPFHDATTREIRVCAETVRTSIVGAGAGTRVRGQVCGRYQARRVS